MIAKKDIKFDCRNFDGSRSCRFKTICKDCNFYSPIDKRILILKFASAGDVLRTTPILPALKEKYPKSLVIWVVKEPAQQLLDGNSCLDRIMVFDLSSVLCLQAEEFDLLISLDKAPEAAALASMVKAGKKCGYGLDSKGKIFPLNKEAEYSFLLGLDDELKFKKNNKTYQELIFEIASLPYKKQRYELKLGEPELAFAENFFRENNIQGNKPVIGIVTGAGRVFANKNLKPDKIIKLIELLNAEMDTQIILLGGPQEKETNEYIIANAKPKIFNSGCEHNLKEYAALINKCSLIITPDTLALHIAIALNKPVVALFGPTCQQEIELYNLGRKLVTDIECAPCYKNECDKELTCMDKIGLGEIVKTVQNIINPIKDRK